MPARATRRQRKAAPTGGEAEPVPSVASFLVRQGLRSQFIDRCRGFDSPAAVNGLFVLRVVHAQGFMRASSDTGRTRRVEEAQVALDRNLALTDMPGEQREEIGLIQFAQVHRLGLVRIVD